MDQRQFEAMLADAETRLRRLRMLYDQWFHGLERVEPRIPRAEVDKLIATLRREQIRNTALRFRLNQVVQRYTTYNTYWQRITRQIEEGTYKRDVLRAKRRYGGEDSAPRPGDGYELDLDIDVEAVLESVADSRPPGLSSRPPSANEPSSERPSRAPREITPFAQPSDRPGAPAPRLAPPPPKVPRLAPPPIGSLAPRLPPSLSPKLAPPPLPAGIGVPPQASAVPKPVAPRPAAAAARPAGVSDAQMQDLYRRYLDARRDNKERTDNVKLESVAKTVREMLPKLAQKHAGKQIDFEVVVRDGRVALKPVAK